jgi:hypothetical protein
MSRLYDKFATKNKNVIGTKYHGASNEDEETQNLCISIPMKNSMNTRADKVRIDEKFIKVIEHEYAVKYLEHLGLAATP